jgi:hypothetical protein
MATGPWDSFKTQQAETSEPQEQGPWAQFSVQKPVEEAAPWTQFAPTVKPQQETTANPFTGALGRVASLAGAGVSAVAEAAERLGDKLELAVPLSGISEEDIKNKKQLQPLFDWAKSLKDFDESLGYQPSTQLKELASNPLKAIPFIAERVVTSSPDMVAAAGVLPAYIAARTKEILDERVKNDNKTLDEATVGDVTAAATAAIVEGTLERFASKGLLKPTTGMSTTGRIAKETGIQAGTEVAEEEAAYLGEAAGTQKGLSAEEALTRGAEAAIVGGGLGATVQGAKELLAPKAAAQEPATPEQAPLEVEKIAADLTQRGITNIEPERVAQFQQTFLDMGLDPAQANIRAIEAATLEVEEKAPASEEAQGEPDAGQTITEPSGDSVQVAGQPDTNAPTGGVGVPESDGMVPAGQDVAGVATGEATQPVAIDPKQKRIEEITQELIGAGLNPSNARMQAEEEFDREQRQEQASAQPVAIVDPFEQTTQPKPLSTLEYFDKRDALMAKLDEVQQQGSDLFDEQEKLRNKGIYEGKGGSEYLDEINEAEKQRQAKNAEFDEIIAQIDALDAERAKTRGDQVGTETTEAVQAEAQGQEAAPAKSDDVIAEEAEISDDVADAVGDITTLPTEEVAEETAPKAKRGRKPLSPEEKVASDERRAQQRKNYKQNEKAVTAAGTALDEALAPIDEETIGSEESLSAAQANKRVGKIQAIKSLVLLARSLKGTKLGDRAAEMLKNPAITPMELENVKKGIAAQVSKATSEVKAGRADSRFSKMTTAQQALRHVIKTGNPFQRFLAQRLLPFVKNVKFRVIEEDAPLPSQITEGGVEADWNESRGMFLRVVATGERFVFVRGTTGGPNQGVNNVTVLHEMLHAALNEKIAAAYGAYNAGKELNANLVKAFDALQGTMDMTLKRVKEMHAAGTLPEFMGELVVSDIFGDPREFVAYAMSHPRFQKFLMETEGVTKQSLFTRFVNNVRQFFNMGPMHTSALADVISVTNSMLSSRLTANMRAELAAERASADATEVSSELKKKKIKTNKMVERMEKSSFADTIRELPGLVNIRSMQDLTDALSSMYAGFDNFKLRQVLPTLQTEAVVQWSERSGVVGIREAWQYLTDMAAMRNKSTLDMVPLSEALAKLARKAPDQMRRLANVMHYSTLLYRDPTVAGNLSKDADLKKMWDGLTDANKKLYEQVRDFYKANHEQYHVLLEEQIANSKLLGTAADGKSPKGKLIAQIKQIYEDGKKLYPYFPLMRYGQYWLRIGKGVNREFYMFENAFDRNMFLRKRIRQMQEAGSAESLREMQESGAIDLGNDLSDARKKDLDASGMLKEIFNSIEEGMKQGQTVVDDYGNTVSSMSRLDADKLMDEIYQMYLQTLPDRNFRRQYMHRQGTTGFSGDIARNFAVTGTNMANQLARIKYGPRIMGELERANDTLAGNPDKARLGEFVTEMRMRAEQQVRPDQEDSLGYKTSALLNSSAYLWLMTSVKTAATQLTALPIFVGPVLTSNHGFNPVKVGAALAKSMAIFGTSGIRRQAEDGSTTFEFPSYLNNGLVKLTDNQKLAAQYMADRGISDNTLAYDLGNRRDTPTNQLEGGVRRAMRTTSRVMTSLFHHTERMIREVTFMTSYDLYSQQTNKETGKKYTHEEALRAAEAETHEALGNYHASNRPRGLLADSERQVLLNAQKPVGRTILQFKMFPAFVTTFFIRNAYRALAGLDAKDRAKAMTQLVGTLTMSTALAGYVGIPGATMAMGAIQGMLNAIRDEDDEDPLEERDLEFWFRNVWLPQTFGNIKIGDHTLDEILDKGLIATMTGYDISGSLSMNNMWVPDVKEQATSAAAIQEYVMSLAGPSASILFKQIPTAIDFFNKGEILRGIEQLAPAFARGSFTAYRYGKEGATTTSGAVIKEAEEFTQGQLLAQSMGFATEGLVARREAIFHLQGEILKVKRERTKLLDRLERELDKGSDEDVEKAFDKVFTFNSRNPYDAIGADNIKQSIKKQIERKMKSDRGMPIDKKYYPQLLELLEPSEKKLERERLMAQ